MVGLHQQNKQEKMSKIGIKNFRVFKEFTEFEIKPITLLTGPNNAGKSSFTKLLLLLKNGINKLNFNEGLHNLESFDKVLNWENKQNTLELSFDNEIPFLTDDFKVQLTYRKNEINKISISNNINTLLQCNYDNDFTSGQSLNELGIESDEYISGRAPFDSFILNLNITFLIDLIYSKQLKQKFYEIKENNKTYLAKQEAEAAKKLEELKAGMSKTASGLLYKISKSNPEGKAPKAGDIVAVHYAGKLTNGKEFDNSFKRGEPIEFSVGVGQVIKGWDEGIMLLKEGETATFLIPSELGYGARGAGGVIPPNAWLIFDVELVKVK